VFHICKSPEHFSGYALGYVQLMISKVEFLNLTIIIRSVRCKHNMPRKTRRERVRFHLFFKAPG